ncbi:ADP-ribosylarginine hydrolase-like protein [Labeo rohita]|uniref:ADP-ribosylarginine hydrolase-like protein n=1 Tax=Labeo rohita TaxID=84645 RepID=A0A498M566_LABRO|nr:ADP-ribosylarginine hydrolase-like protein [Labeo rohita]
MLLSGVGDALGYRNQLWEFNQSGPAIHKELQALGGLKNISVELPDWPISDDTVLHLATAEALATGKAGEELLHEVAFQYVEGMKDMKGRMPGVSTIQGDSDSTAVIACCCWGLLYGMDGVPQCNYINLEYRDRLESVAQKLYALSH